MDMKLELKDISKSFGSKQVLSTVNVTFFGGQVYSIVGPNGSGKSVLLKMIAGILTPSTGTIKLNDTSLNKKTVCESNIGICIDKSQMIEELTGLDNLLYLSSFKKVIDREGINLLLKEFNLFEDRNKKVKDYSMGMKQKLSIIQAFMEDQNIVLFDEVSNSLDESSKQQLFRLIEKLKESKKIVIYVNHNMEEVKKISDTIYQIDNRGLIEC